MLKQFIEQLSKELSILAGEFSTKNEPYELEIEPNLQISLRENPESGITLFTTIGSLPEQKTSDFLQWVMNANLFGKETGGGVLGLDKTEKKLTFSYFLPHPLSYREFRDSLEDFANYTESWRIEMNQWPFEQSTIK